VPAKLPFGRIEILAALVVVVLAGFGAVAVVSEAGRADELPDFRPAARALKRDAPARADEEAGRRFASGDCRESKQLSAALAPAPSHAWRRGRDTHLRIGVLLI
jgi:hypothetical protein